MEQRDAIFQMRIGAAEREMLRELAEAEARSSSDLVRLLIRRAHAAAFGEKKSKPKPRRAASTRRKS